MKGLKKIISEKGTLRWVVKVFIILLAAVAVEMLIKSTSHLARPKLDATMGLGLLLLFGLLTSVHCVGMCGGLMLTQCVRKKEDGRLDGIFPAMLRPALYSLGRVVSYTAIGAVIGGIGQILSLSAFFKSLVPVAGGLFMMILAFNLLGVFPFLRRFQFGIPGLPFKKMRSGGYGPFVLGVLTGIMPCGPLQMAQMYALATGSIFDGALSMFLFSVGTVPCLFVFGSFSSFMTKRFSNAVGQVGAVLILLLGISMVSRGLSFHGILQFPGMMGPMK